MKVEKTIIMAIFFLLPTYIIFSQCKYYDKLIVGGNFNSSEYIDHCPTFKFSVDAGKSDVGYYYLDRPMDLAPSNIDEIKSNLEALLSEKIGKDFVDKLSFKSVAISYYDSISKFHARYPVVDMSKCKTKYFFFYNFEPIKDVKYCVGIALDDYQQIISELLFPEEEEKRILDSELTVCKVIEIAKEAGPSIEPIESVSFEFDPNKKEFFWVVRQQIVNPQKGVNEYNQILIEARDASQVVAYRRTVYIK